MFIRALFLLGGVPLIGENRIPAMRRKKAVRRGNRKLLYFVFFFFLSVLAVLFFQSPISRITQIDVSGNRHLSDQEILQAANIRLGDHFFGVRAESIQERVQSLDVIENAEVKKEFPGKILIRVKEFDEVAYTFSPEGAFSVVLENGIQIAKEHFSGLMHKPFLSGWTENEKKDFVRLCQALANIPAEQLANISEIRPDPSPAYPDKIKLYTTTKHEVTTTVSYLPQKMKYLNAYISGRSPGYITMLETDYYRPYQISEEKKEPKETTQ